MWTEINFTLGKNGCYIPSSLGSRLRPTVKCGIPDALLFNEKDFIAMIMYSRLRSVDINCSYGYFFNKSSAYKCLVVDLKKYP